MTTTNKVHRYPAELRHRIIHLVRSGRTPEALSREFEPSAQTIRNWLAQAELADNTAPHCHQLDHEKLQEADSEIRRLRADRAILKSAAGWFAREATRDQDA